MNFLQYTVETHKRTQVAMDFKTRSEDESVDMSQTQMGSQQQQQQQHVVTQDNTAATTTVKSKKEGGDVSTTTSTESQSQKRRTSFFFSPLVERERGVTDRATKLNTSLRPLTRHDNDDTSQRHT